MVGNIIGNVKGVQPVNADQEHMAHMLVPVVLIRNRDKRSKQQ
jgi:hypothetical protein